MIAGLAAPTAGRILIGGDDVTALPPHKRRIGLVFQSFALFPHMSVRENVAFGLRRQGLGGAELERRVAAALELVRLGALAGRAPKQLSGGQQQRVALARAIAPEPRLLLLDEPLSSLDAQLREEMQIELKRLQRELGVTSLFVTHDQSEALSLSDRVCILDRGEVQQIGTPEEVYHAPANAFVATFIGRSNRLAATVAGSDGGWTELRLAGGLSLRAASVPFAQGTSVQVTLRQEAFGLGGGADTNLLTGRVVLRSFSGASVQYVVDVGGVELVAELPTQRGRAGPVVGEEVVLSYDPGAVIVVPA
jgi:iron(III) transport system ATP-binding protein/putative spermidine/putrescine transport system ATP-binding protein